MILILTKADRNKRKTSFEKLDIEDFTTSMSKIAQVDSAWYVEGDRVFCLKDRRPKERGGHPKGEVKLGPIARQTIRFFTTLIGSSS